MVKGQLEMFVAALAAGEIAPMPSSSRAAKPSVILVIMTVLPLVLQSVETEYAGSDGCAYHICGRVEFATTPTAVTTHGARLRATRGRRERIPGSVSVLSLQTETLPSVDSVLSRHFSLFDRFRFPSFGPDESFSRGSLPDSSAPTIENGWRFPVSFVLETQ